MLNTRNYLLTFVALVCLGVISGWLSSITDKTVRVVSPKPVGVHIPRASPQRAKERIWHSVAAKELVTIGEDPENILFQPVQVRADKDGNVYVLDWGDLKIKKFSPEGRFLLSFGTGKGQGPGELVTPSDFTITEDQMVWVIDMDNLRITAFDSASAVVRTISVKGQSSRLACCPSNGTLVISPSSVREYLFGVIRLDGQALDMFGEFIADQRKNLGALDGRLMADGCSGFVYAFLRAGYIVSFDFAGKMRFYVQTIDPIPFPPLSFTERSGMVQAPIDKNAPYASMSMNLDGGEIYVLCMNESLKQKVAVIDAYRKDNGSYIYSFKLPAWADRAYITKSHVYTILDSTVTKWQR